MNNEQLKEAAEGEMKILGPTFPNLPKSVPFSKLDEQWAQKIHGQTLERLNERGGLSITEMIGNIKRYDFSKICRLTYCQQNADYLLKLIK